MKSSELTKYFEDNYKTILPGFLLEGKEFNVWGSLTDFQDDDDSRGVIDYIFKRGKNYYITEVDFTGRKWHVFKVFAYRAAFIIDRNRRITDPEVRCLAIISDRAWTHNLRNIFAILNISWVVLNTNGEVVSKEILK